MSDKVCYVNLFNQKLLLSLISADFVFVMVVIIASDIKRAYPFMEEK